MFTLRSLQNIDKKVFNQLWFGIFYRLVKPPIQYTPLCNWRKKVILSRITGTTFRPLNIILHTRALLFCCTLRFLNFSCKKLLRIRSQVLRICKISIQLHNYNSMWVTGDIYSNPLGKTSFSAHTKVWYHFRSKLKK